MLKSKIYARKNKRNISFYKEVNSNKNFNVFFFLKKEEQENDVCAICDMVVSIGIYFL